MLKQVLVQHHLSFSTALKVHTNKTFKNLKNVIIINVYENFFQIKIIIIVYALVLEECSMNKEFFLEGTTFWLPLKM